MPKVATISLTSTSDKNANIAAAFEYLEKAAQLGADWILLPEIFAYHGDYAYIHANAEAEDGPLNQALAKFAREHKVVVMAGSVGERPGIDEEEVNAAGQKKVFNTTYIFGRDGSLLQKYRKTHLFNLIDESGTPLYCESNGFIAGNETKTATIDGMHCGLAICYDLRFPAFFQKLNRERPIDVLIIPSAFTKKTGAAHWELLLRARAVELQAYVYAANQTGQHSPGKESFGHSMVIDPWGDILCDTGTEPGVVTADISLERIKEIRAQLPALKNLRSEIY